MKTIYEDYLHYVHHLVACGCGCGEWISAEDAIWDQDNAFVSREHLNDEAYIRQLFDYEEDLESE